MRERRKVVIVGGGFGGLFCGRALEFKSGGRAYRLSKLSPIPTGTLSSPDGLGLAGRDRLGASSMTSNNCVPQGDHLQKLSATSAISQYTDPAVEVVARHG